MGYILFVGNSIKGRNFMKFARWMWLSGMIITGMAALSYAGTNSTVSASTHTYQCPDLVVTIINSTEHKIAGGIWGNTGNLGSGGYSVGANNSRIFGLPSQSYPQGNTFGVVGVIQLVDNEFITPIT